MSDTDIIKAKAIHYRGTEDTEVFMLAAPAAHLTIIKLFSVSSVPLW